jgi:hypothetical protein
MLTCHRPRSIPIPVPRTRGSAAWNERSMATSSIMFMHIVGNSVGAAVFGAILNCGINRRIPKPAILSGLRVTLLLLCPLL